MDGTQIWFGQRDTSADGNHRHTHPVRKSIDVTKRCCQIQVILDSNAEDYRNLKKIFFIHNIIILCIREIIFLIKCTN